MVLVIDTENPQSLEALKSIIAQVVDEKVTPLLEDMKVSSGGEKSILDTDEVQAEFNLSKATLHNYHKRGLKYFPASPNRYFREDIMQFFRNNLIQH
ncbi:MAG TPA: hypothetical protein DCG19_03855 [Cryomorphaceae bacterium]|nr:hypothetical protein [Owenweeksia sp.]MBF97869.1 hypothetical protein [Owenweeksia sp.]HAD96514.1 hypothetical protein [Cryomorphaceae bacterium]HBF19785.1 hypothetical protein [Cryomorphaceae bacterium]HCQ17129.1 hypothetical protein [Cryomorphaceae bacterium]|tara:strand:+ start:492 stop:782 length:291 start_codon:yes stop_codon:yes gene_type:complete